MNRDPGKIRACGSNALASNVHTVIHTASERFGSVICVLYLYGVRKRVRAHGPRRMPAACGRGWTGASADGIDFPTLVQRAGIAFASLTRFAEGVGRC